MIPNDCTRFLFTAQSHQNPSCEINYSYAIIKRDVLDHENVRYVRNISSRYVIRK